MRNNPFHLPGDNSGPSARRGPGGAASGCYDMIKTFFDEWCCDWDPWTCTCKHKCPIIKLPSTKTIKKCIKSHDEWITVCNGKEIRYR